MQLWIKNIFNPFIKSKKLKPEFESCLSMLLMDNFSVHTTTLANIEIAKSGTKILMLPPNLTSKLQLMDVGLNKPFKSRIKDLFNAHLVKEMQEQFEEHGENPNKFQLQYSKITRQVIAQWISNAWISCSNEINVLNSLRSMGYITQ